MGLVICPLVNTTKLATIAGFLLFFLCLLIGTIVCTMDTAIYSMFSSSWMDSYGPWGYILSVLPPFSFSLALITLKVITMGSYQTSMPTSYVSWNDIYDNPSYFATYGLSEAPTLLYSIYCMLFSTLLFLSVAFYLDNVWPHEDEAPKRWYFPISPNYWGFKSCHRSASFPQYSQAVPLLAGSNSDDSDVGAESVLAATGQGEDLLLRVHRLNKTYDPWQFMPRWVVRLCSKAPFAFMRPNRPVKAVQNLSLCGEKGTVLCVLGENGAGKVFSYWLNGVFAVLPVNTRLQMHN